MAHKGARDFGLIIGQLPTGPTNSIADIDGLSFGHVTLSDGPIQTGITAIQPVPDSIFENKCVAASHVINGFGKSVGLMQLDELGQLETPIVLTNTLCVGTASTALVRYMLETNPAIGETTGTVNPVVLECNDGAYLNDIRGMHVSEDHVQAAVAQSEKVFEQGAIGAGTGMSSYGLKGGLGSASRVVSIGSHAFTLGALTLCNMGLLPDLLVAGSAVGVSLSKLLTDSENHTDERGSIIILLATDAPLSSRQLKRICRRASAGLARTGTQLGSGSGDIVLGFTTTGRVHHYCGDDPVFPTETLHEDCLDILFRATIESVEEAILNALFASKSTKGKHDRVRTSLSDVWPKLSQNP